MRTRIGRSLVLLPSLGLLALTLVAAPVAAQDDCTMSVKPKNGGPGTEFVFSGSGFEPSRIVLRQADGPAKTVTVTPSGTGDFEVRLVAGKDDTGAWKAIAIEPGVCRASVGFSVGLPPTSTIGPSDDGLRGAALAGFAALGGLFVAAGVVVLPRLTRNARSR
jgi:hypothetical protein